MFALGAAYAIRESGSDAGVEYIENGGTFDRNNPKQQFYFSLALLALGFKDMAREHATGLREQSVELADRLKAFVDAAKNRPS